MGQPRVCGQHWRGHVLRHESRRPVYHWRLRSGTSATHRLIRYHLVRRMGGFTSVRIGASALLGLSLSCGPDDGVVHPTPANAPPGDASLIAHDSLPVGLTPARLAHWREVRDAFLGARDVLRLGKDTEGPELFGSITDAEFDSEGNLVILDAGAQLLRFFDRTGRAIGAIGGVGDGPMEMRRAERFALLGDDRIGVVMRPRRMKVFVRQTSGWVLDKTVQLPLQPHSLCSHGSERVYLSGWKDETDNSMVHGFIVPHDSRTVESTESFGPGYQDDEWLLRYQLSDGFVECLPDRNQIVFGFAFLPLLRSHALDGGAIVWSARPQQHTPMKIIETRHPANGSVQVTRSRQSRYDFLGTVLRVSADHLLVQYARVRPLRRHILPESYLVDLASGTGAFLGTDIPPVLAVRHGAYIAAFEDPFPRIEVREFTDPETGWARW